MNTKETLNRFENLVRQYIRGLEPLTIEQLTRKPSDDEWSLGQMYLHLIQGTLYLHLRNIEACREQAAETGGTERKTEAGRLVFAQGSFPGIRIQVPATPEYTPAQPESKEQLVAGLNDVVRRMQEVEPALADMQESGTKAHPRFGDLNAVEWFQLVEMHYRHHLLQKARLEQFVGLSSLPGESSK
ncbi:DinB family protein [Paenibacillus allorhizosphaerae]|uniref:DinB-like domain-containing protein n=1 Tax=Paenibacillus allorhizosphaerae TaxID=2849866 RepID=A0ABN7TX17_9BACL|nr:DinB family protein [Paenibacillus allorhizosphaerae]CAG7655787.1 hypothetical protein PAECIP111802_06207 [Paenibacillus allorhizosphaerae]